MSCTDYKFIVKSILIPVNNIDLERVQFICTYKCGTDPQESSSFTIGSIEELMPRIDEVFSIVGSIPEYKKDEFYQCIENKDYPCLLLMGDNESS